MFTFVINIREYSMKSSRWQAIFKIWKPSLLLKKMACPGKNESEAFIARLEHWCFIWNMCLHINTSGVLYDVSSVYLFFYWTPPLYTWTPSLNTAIIFWTLQNTSSVLVYASCVLPDASSVLWFLECSIRDSYRHSTDTARVRILSL